MLVFSLRLPNIIGLSYQIMLKLLTYKEPMNMFFDTVSRVKIFVEGRGARLTVRWHMKDKWHRYLFFLKKKHLILRSSVCARLD